MLHDPFEFTESSAEDWISDDIKRKQDVALRSPIKGDRFRLAKVQEQISRTNEDLEDIESYSREDERRAKRRSFTRKSHSPRSSPKAAMVIDPRSNQTSEKRKLAPPSVSFCSTCS